MILANIKDLQWEILCRKFSVFHTIHQWIKTHEGKTDRDCYELIGKRAFVMVQKYTTSSGKDSKFESHIKYADLHYIAEGTERNAWQKLNALEKQTEYDEEKDFQLHHIPANYLSVALYPGDMTIFFPEDAHIPRLSNSAPTAVTKYMFKIHVDLFNS